MFFLGASSPDPSTVFVDMRALRNDRVALVERGSPHSLQVMESGKVIRGFIFILGSLTLAPGLLMLYVNQSKSVVKVLILHFTY